MDDEQRVRSAPEDTVGTETPASMPARDAGPDGESDAKPVSRKLRLTLEALLLGAVFARDFFAKAPVQQRRRPGPLDEHRIDVPLETLTGVPSHTAVEQAHPVQKTGREADRDLDVASESKKEARERQGTFVVVCAFLISVAGAIGFLFSYWMGLSNQMLGASLAIFLGGFGFALVMYSHWLMSHKQATEPREKMASSPQAREALQKDYCAAAHDVRRRSMLMWMGAAGTGLFAAMILSMMRSLGMSPYPELYDTVWKRGQRLMTADGKPVTVDTLEQGSTITVFPEDKIGKENAQTVLIRVEEKLLRLPANRSGWAPNGNIAYSRVCTHAGCPVALFESGTNILLCPCHQSTFDVLRAASPTGGPAARPLPQLPLYADSDGTLRAGGGFTAPPGPGFWGMS